MSYLPLNEVIYDFFAMPLRITRTGMLSFIHLVIQWWLGDVLHSFSYSGVSCIFRFLRSGVYLVLEKLELQVYQRLLKKMYVLVCYVVTYLYWSSNSRKCLTVRIWSRSYIIQKQKDPNKAHQIKLEVVVKAFRWLEIDMDIDEVSILFQYTRGQESTIQLGYLTFLCIFLRWNA